jgi:hypothetical protein
MSNPIVTQIIEQVGSDLEVVIRFNALLAGGCSRG